MQPFITVTSYDPITLIRPLHKPKQVCEIVKNHADIAPHHNFNALVLALYGAYMCVLLCKLVT